MGLHILHPTWEAFLSKRNRWAYSGAGLCLLFPPGSIPMDATEGVFTCRIVGFLLGFSLASSYTAYRLVDEYKQASAILQASVEELQATTIKAGSFYRIITSISQ